GRPRCPRRGGDRAAPGRLRSPPGRSRPAGRGDRGARRRDHRRVLPRGARGAGGPRVTSMPAAAPAVPAPTLAAIGELFEEAVRGHRTSGITWAIIGGHAHQQAVLGHGAAGHRELVAGRPTGAGPMDRATVSRIASMTKSFTAATILALRDERRLGLDDPVSTYVPEAAGAFELAADEREPTLRQLLTMSAGLVTDNPWGDRQEAMTREEFAATLRGGLGHVHRAGTGFEYSNTSYALL